MLCLCASSADVESLRLLISSRLISSLKICSHWLRHMRQSQWSCTFITWSWTPAERFPSLRTAPGEAKGGQYPLHLEISGCHWKFLKFSAVFEFFCKNNSFKVSYSNSILKWLCINCETRCDNEWTDFLVILHQPWLWNRLWISSQDSDSPVKFRFSAKSSRHVGRSHSAVGGTKCVYFCCKFACVIHDEYMQF